MKKVIILGAGGHARSVLNAFRDANKSKKHWHILGFIDDNKKLHGKIICDAPVLGGFDWFDINKRNDIYLMNAIASPKVKKEIVESAYKRKLQFCNFSTHQYGNKIM